MTEKQIIMHLKEEQNKKSKSAKRSGKVVKRQPKKGVPKRAASAAAADIIKTAAIGIEIDEEMNGVHAPENDEMHAPAPNTIAEAAGNCEAAGDCSTIDENSVSALMNPAIDPMMYTSGVEQNFKMDGHSLSLQVYMSTNSCVINRCRRFDSVEHLNEYMSKIIKWSECKIFTGTVVPLHSFVVPDKLTAQTINFNSSTRFVLDGITYTQNLYQNELYSWCMNEITGENCISAATKTLSKIIKTLSLEHAIDPKLMKLIDKKRKVGNRTHKSMAMASLVAKTETDLSKFMGIENTPEQELYNAVGSIVAIDSLLPVMDLNITNIYSDDRCAHEYDVSYNQTRALDEAATKIEICRKCQQRKETN